jgi:glyceraldehyde-3-phosphate dehydrogenase/erythrose-4-phosphate dehydrogenase
MSPFINMPINEDNTADPMMVGINGIGRIGKVLFLQMISSPEIRLCAINASGEIKITLKIPC